MPKLFSMPEASVLATESLKKYSMGSRLLLRSVAALLLTGVLLPLSSCSGFFFKDTSTTTTGTTASNYVFVANTGANTVAGLGISSTGNPGCADGFAHLAEYDANGTHGQPQQRVSVGRDGVSDLRLQHRDRRHADGTEQRQRHRERLSVPTCRPPLTASG